MSAATPELPRRTVKGQEVVPAAGFEPATYRLQGGCSTN